MRTFSGEIISSVERRVSFFELTIDANIVLPFCPLVFLLS